MTPLARRLARAAEALLVIAAGVGAALLGLAHSVVFVGLVVYFLGTQYLRSPRVPVSPPAASLPGPWTAGVPGARLPEQRR